MTSQAQAQAQSESESKIISTLSLPISMYESVKLIDSQVGYDITRTIYYSEYKIYRADFIPQLNFNNDVLKYSGNINDHDNKLFEDIIHAPIYDLSKNSIQLGMIAIEASMALPEPVLDINIVTQILSTYNIKTIYSYKIYTYILDRVQNLNLENLNSLNPDLLRQNSDINLTVINTRYQILANYISNIVASNLSDIDFTAELQKQISTIITNGQTFLYAPKDKTIELGHNVKLRNGGNIFVVMSPQIVYPYCVDVLIRKRKTFIILKKIFDDLKINYSLDDIESFYNNYMSQNYLYIDNPKKIPIPSSPSSPSSPKLKSKSESENPFYLNYVLWGASSCVSLIILILIIVIIKIL